MTFKFSLSFILSVFVYSSMHCQIAGLKLDWANGLQDGWSWGVSVTTDLNGNAYTTSEFQGSVNIELPSGNDTLFTSTNKGCLIQKFDTNGNPVWTKLINGTGGSVEWGSNILVDEFENVYVSGTYIYEVDFDPSENTALYNSNGDRNIFLLKLNESGNFEYVKIIEGMTLDTLDNAKVLDMSFDHQGNLLLCGFFSGEYDFDPNSGITNISGLNYADKDAFILNIDLTGNLIWIKTLEGYGESSCSTMRVDDIGNVILIGKGGGATDFDPGAGIVNAVGTIFTLKLNTNGEYIWVKTLEGLWPSGIWEEGLEVDDNGNIYTLGRFKEDIDFDPSANQFLINSNGNQDIFVQKLDSNGNLVWAKNYGGVRNEFSKVNCN